MSNTITGKIRLVVACLVLTAAAFAQFKSSSVLYVGTAPSGACTGGARMQVLINTTGAAYTCQNVIAGAGTWGTLASAGTIISPGIVDGLAPVTVTTGTSATLGAGTYSSGYTFNEEATPGQAVTYTLPVAAAGKQYCAGNANGGAANTGVLTVATSAAGQFIIFTDGSLSATGGNVTSGGAAGDFACFIGVDATHWYIRPGNGTWTKH